MNSCKLCYVYEVNATRLGCQEDQAVLAGQYVQYCIL